ncbi:hypothetical protein FRUB_06446 [Fimbriiglobus ruber]|uniref:Uncharacterized protein n=1 Tax=Fimbriiglobus ruber TaxID=1908690 RepID=A0A225DIN8_9BACT|nr:hypothetical protein FRUB_06446 [Fimbriiglobus ruber]
MAELKPPHDAPDRGQHRDLHGYEAVAELKLLSRIGLLNL